MAGAPRHASAVIVAVRLLLIARPIQRATRRSYGGQRRSSESQSRSRRPSKGRTCWSLVPELVFPPSAGSLSRLSGSRAERASRCPPSTRGSNRSGRSNPDRRAWHLRRRHPMPDEDVAAAQRSAGRAQGRAAGCGCPAFPSGRRRSHPTPAHRAQRLLAAACANRDAGALEACARAVGRRRGWTARRARAGACRVVARADRVGAAARRRRRPPTSERGETPRATRPEPSTRDVPRGARGRYGQRH